MFYPLQDMDNTIQYDTTRKNTEKVKYISQAFAQGITSDFACL